jgi:hypothetical protein
MSKFHTAETVCSHLNQQLIAVKRGIQEQPSELIPTEYTTRIIIQNKLGVESEPQAKVVKILLDEACKKVFPELPHIWKEPEKVASENYSSASTQASYLFKCRIVSDEPLTHKDLETLHNVSLRQQFEKIRKEVACKIPFKDKPGDELTSYSIKKENFQNISPENFVKFLELLREEYGFGDKLKVQYDGEKVAVSISKTTAKTIFEKEQLGNAISKNDLSREFNRQAEIQQQLVRKKSPRNKGGSLNAITAIPSEENSVHNYSDAYQPESVDTYVKSHVERLNAQRQQSTAKSVLL